jgi:hypothetical protein
MPQICTVCSHKENRGIDLAIVAGKLSDRNIAKQFGVTYSAVFRHRQEHLPEILKRGYEAQKNADASAVMDELQRCIKLTNKVLAACDEWLTDPEQTDRYSLDPRADELTVIYSEPNGDGKPHKKKATLDELLARVRVLPLPGRSIEMVETKRADPRELILKAIAQLRPQAELLARLEGKLKDTSINVLINPEWLAVRGALMKALAPFPEAREVVAAALLSVEANVN